ncbi:MAG: DUF421 domain-containing protein [Clostridia bacterium]|nr:DUF421 domain-containing protein [Clostridia bacterium]
MFTIIIRTLIIFFMLTAVFHLTGKRQIGELDLSELITALLLSEVAAAPIVNHDLPLVMSIVAVVVLVTVEIILSFITTRSSAVKRLLGSKPSVIIRGGRLDIAELSKVRMSIEELMSELRIGGAAGISEVAYAVMEPSGKMSVLLRTDCPDGIDTIVISDGRIDRGGLEFTQKNEEWLYRKLEESGHILSDIFLMTVNDSGVVRFIAKEKKK